MAADFASEYGIRLATVDMSWHEFRGLLCGLLQADSRLWRHFHKPEKPQMGGVF